MQIKCTNCERTQTIVGQFDAGGMTESEAESVGWTAQCNGGTCSAKFPDFSEHDCYAPDCLLWLCPFCSGNERLVTFTHSHRKGAK